MSGAFALAALPLAPALAGGALLLGGARLRRAAGPTAILVAAAILALAVPVAAAAPAAAWLWLPAGGGLGLSLAAAGAAGLFAVVIATVTLAVVAYANWFLAANEARARFFGFMLLFAGAMLGLALAADLLTLLIVWEVVGLCSYALIGFWHNEADRARDATRAFLSTRTADLGLYVAAMAAWAGGSLSLAALPDLPPGLRATVAGGLLLSALGKSAQLPFSGWLSGAMSGPAPVSALLHSAAMVAAGAILLIKVLPLLEAEPWAAAAVLWIGVATALAGGLIALAQDDLKQLLAASTVSQFGFIFAAIGALGAAAASAHLVNHAAFKALLFLGAGVLIAHGLHRLSEMKGAGGALPLLSLLFLAGALALAAAPPMGGFLSKEEVLAAVRGRHPLAYALLLAASVLTAWYAGRAWIGAFMGGDRSALGGRHDGRLLLPMAALALAALAGGLLLLPPVKSWWDATIAQGLPLPQPHWWEFALALIALALGVTAAWRTRGTTLSFLGADRWLGLPAALDATGRAAIAAAGLLHRRLGRLQPAESVAAAGLTLSGRVRQAEAALDSGIGLVADGGLLGARGARLSDRRLLDGTLTALTGALDRISGVLRRAQAGLLHRYYAGVVAGLLVLFAYAALLLAV